jgi:glycine oxidase
MTQDVIVIGGGVIGCSIALSLAEAGLKVTLVERGRIGEEASWAAAGMLSPQAAAAAPSPLFELSLRSLAIYKQFSSRVAELSGVDPEYQDTGTLCVAMDEDDRLKIDLWSDWQLKSTLKLEQLDARGMRAAEPALTDRLLSGVFLPADHQIDNRRLMAGLAIAINRRGVQTIEGEEVESLVCRGNRVEGVISNGRRLSSGTTILAAGCWSGHLICPADFRVEVIPARGQMLALKGNAAPISHVIHFGGCYLVPRQDGRILVGSTVEYVGYEKGLTAAGVGFLLSAAVKVIPSLSEFSIVEFWSGLRPDTADHLPVIGPSGLDNLLFATGHFRNGILLAPITARILTQVIVEGELPEISTPFSPARFHQAVATT